MTVKVNDKIGIDVHEYQGNYTLQEVYPGQDKWFKNWVFRSKWENSESVPFGKAIPMGVRLGDKPLDILKELYNQVANLDKKAPF